jgi:lysophospholipase L1-like esterase
MIAEACSQQPTPSPLPPQPAPPVAKETPPANEAKAWDTPGPPIVMLATAVEGEADAGAAAEAPAPLTGKTILHVGDSMVGGNWGLTRALEGRFTAEGAKFVRDYKVSESIISYDKSPKLKELLAKHKPDIVIITLGTNDVFVPYPASMANNVQSIVKRIGSRECYWMGPPTWKPDTGIVQVIKDNAAPCKFFDGTSLKLERGHDGIHPTDKGGAEWATRFWSFFRPAIASADAGAP